MYEQSLDKKDIKSSRFAPVMH